MSITFWKTYTVMVITYKTIELRCCDNISVSVKCFIGNISCYINSFSDNMPHCVNISCDGNNLKYTITYDVKTYFDNKSFFVQRFG